MHIENFRGTILSLEGRHYLCKSYWNYETSHARTSLWAKVQTESGDIVDVWILKERGNGKRSRKQEMALEAKHAEFVGKIILFTKNWKGIRFFEGLAEDQLSC